MAKPFFDATEFSNRPNFCTVFGARPLLLVKDSDLNRSIVPEYAGNSYPLPRRRELVDMAYRRAAQTALGRPDIHNDGPRNIYGTVTATGASMTAGSDVVNTTGGAVFTAADGRKQIYIPGAGLDGGVLISTVRGYNGPRQVRIMHTAYQSVSGVNVSIAQPQMLCFNLEAEPFPTELKAEGDRGKRRTLLRRLARLLSIVATEQKRSGIISPGVGLYLYPPHFLREPTGNPVIDQDLLEQAREDFGPIVRRVDYFAPDVYFDGSYVGNFGAWNTMLLTQVARLRSLSATKPIYPFVNPYVTTGAQRGQLIPRSQWQQSISAVLANCQGAVLWCGINYSAPSTYHNWPDVSAAVTPYIQDLASLAAAA